jgi:hypothetical protein
MKTGRNEPCPCGSGKKYKYCCEGKTPWYKQPTWAGILIVLVLLSAALLAWSQLTSEEANTDAQGRVWSPEHGHYH